MPSLSQRRDNAIARAEIAKAKLAETTALYRANFLKNSLKTRAYDGAKLGRHTSGWFTGGGSANAEILPSLSRLRDRARSLCRDDAHGKKAIRILTTNTVGTGITIKTPYQEQWDRWCDVCDADGQLDFYGLQALAARTIFESGEVLGRFRHRFASDGMEVPLQIQMLEPDYLDTLKDSHGAGPPFVIAGIDHDILGRRTGYWLFDQHPGDAGSYAAQISRKVSSRFILHPYNKERPGQVRGVPELHAALLLARDLDDWDEAELLRKKVEACFVAFVRTDDENRVLGNVETDNSAPRIEKMTPATIEYMRANEEITFGSPQGITDSDYRKAMLKKFAASCNINYEQLTGDHLDVNFSSMKAAIVEARLWFDQWTWNTFIPMFIRPLYREWVDTAFAAGAIKSQEYGVTYTPPKRPWLDPPKDVGAAIDQLGAGIVSLQEVHRGLGYDTDQVLQEHADLNKLLEKHGLSLNFIRPKVDETEADEESAPVPVKKKLNGKAKSASLQ